MIITGVVSVMSGNAAPAATVGATSCGATKLDVAVQQEDDHDLT